MPLSFLLSGTIPWRLIGVIGGLLLLGFSYFEVVRISHLEGQLKIMSQTANDNAAIAKVAQQSADRANQIAVQVNLDAQASRKKLSKMHRTIIDAPSSDDGLLAPVLRRALDGLSGQDRDKNGARAFSNPAG